MHQDQGNRRVAPHDFDVTAIRYRLLCMENARLSNSHKELVGDACRIGSLVFIKTVFDQFGCWGPSHKVWAGSATIPEASIVNRFWVVLVRIARIDCNR
jgi:hypothetical protein